MKRFVPILLSLAVLLPAFSGCGDQSGAAASPTPASEAGAGAALAEAPTATEAPVLTPRAFTADRYLLSADAAAYLGNARDDYAALIDAVCAGAPEAQLSGYESAALAAEVFAESPYSALAGLEIAENGAVTITPAGSGSAEEFDSAAELLVEGAVYAESNELETAVSLYRAVSAGCTYAESGENSLYRMIVEQEGGNAEFAAALCYLFNQNGIAARIASGTAGDTEHRWVIAELGGQPYHFDPTFENSATGGRGLSYFGMSDAARIYTGCALPCTAGRGGYAETLGAPCPDTHFDEFFTDVTSWDCDVRAHFLYLAYGFETEYLNSIETGLQSTAEQGEIAVQAE
ncbi:MAG: transglutaminase domain-containing protein [Acutalibacteraceae bacterium]|nr:hypothetical protein [Clostridiales bacterium]MEE0156312.1 transglutaminase domain-containing protein [Acutalibacteraceae bacterium]